MLPLDELRVAIVVGDVVGQGAAAAAVMGQLRSALAGYLIEGHPPATALDRLDRFAQTVDGALGSTAACMIVDQRTDTLCWARAGHLPPLVIDPTSARFLRGAEGTVLGVRQRRGFTEATAALPAGASVLLYTDGLVERRHEVVDTGLARLAAAARTLHDRRPDELAAELLERCLDSADPADDVALIIARMLPADLRLRLPARPDQLRVLRGAVSGWMSAAGLPPDVADDLQLAVGEAAANAIEHAYGGRPGETFDVALRLGPDATVHARVRDSGAWLPPNADPGHRGRGLDLIKALSGDLTILRGDAGTDVTFRIPVQAHRPAPVAWPQPASGGPATAVARLARTGSVLRIEIEGELDIAGAAEVRDPITTGLGGVTEVEIDLRRATYLASAGVSLLLDAAERVSASGGLLTVLAAPAGAVRRVLAMSGVEHALAVRDRPAR